LPLIFQSNAFSVGTCEFALKLNSVATSAIPKATNFFMFLDLVLTICTPMRRNITRSSIFF
jgi:hypothetical protein